MATLYLMVGLPCSGKTTRAKELESEIVFMDVEEEELIKRMKIRNENLTNTVHYIPEEMMRFWIQFFQKPDANDLLPREKD
jgi:predicted kinase